MLNIYYQDKILNAPLLVSLSQLKPTKIEKFDNYVVGFNNDKLVFININNSSNYKKLNNGLVFASKAILDLIRQITSFDVSDCFDNGFVVGKIIEAKPVCGTHLQQCKVMVKDNKILSIICGASNARENLKVVVATNGTMLPSGKMISSGKVMNIFSEGMLCSYKELEINQPLNGIIELDDNYEVGSYFLAAYAN